MPEVNNNTQPICVRCGKELTWQAKPKHLFTDSLVYLGLAHTTCAYKCRYVAPATRSVWQAALELYALFHKRHADYRSPQWHAAILTGEPSAEGREARLASFNLNAETAEAVRQEYAQLVAEFERCWTPDGGLHDPD